MRARQFRDAIERLGTATYLGSSCGGLQEGGVVVRRLGGTAMKAVSPCEARSRRRRRMLALGFRFSQEMDIVRNGELEATNYFFSIGDADDVLERARPV